MPRTLHESNIEWTFEDGWDVIQYDTTIWYKQRFKGCCDSKAVDFIAIDANCSTLWLIEVKDFTFQQPEASKDLAAIVPKKVRDTLAGILAGAMQAGSPSEQNFFRTAIKAPALRVAFHCEGPKHRSSLFNRLPDQADLQQSLRRSLRALGCRPIVMTTSDDHSRLPWSSRWQPTAEEQADDDPG